MLDNANDYKAPEVFSRWRTIALGVGGIFTLVILIAALIGTPEQKEQALRSWLLGFIFWGGIGIGCLGILILQYLFRGAWSVIVRRVVEAGSRTLPVILILFLPILAGVGYLYEWAHNPNDVIVQYRGWYQTPMAFGLRSLLYFALWGVMVYLLNKWGANQDNSANYDESAKWLGTANAFCGPTMVFFVLVVTFASVDWVMSLDPHWFSTIWGLLYVVGWALSAFCFVVVILASIADQSPMNRILGKKHFHDIGKLMLALVMVWAYFNFSQYLIIWSGNLPEETAWYLTRYKGVWGWIAVILIFFHFAFPFLLLLNRDLKRNSKWLAMVAIFILVLRLIDYFFMIGPSPRTYGTGAEWAYHVSWMDFVAPIAVGGIWLWAFFGQIQKRPIVPFKDPFLDSAIEHGRGH
jgi:hypothetical protein